MKTKKLFLIIALVVGCAVGAVMHRHVQAMQLLKFVLNLQLSR